MADEALADTLAETLAKTLEGWRPDSDGADSLNDVIDKAFEYRGNVTLRLTNGNDFVCFISNRDASVADPFIQVFDEAGDGPTRILYSEVATIWFTGKDAAAGKSYEAWLAKKAEERDAITSRPIEG